jgi:hypothetical protein
MIEKNVIGREHIVYILLRNKGRRENKKNYTYTKYLAT